MRSDFTYMDELITSLRKVPDQPITTTVTPLRAAAPTPFAPTGNADPLAEGVPLGQCLRQRRSSLVYEQEPLDVLPLLDFCRATMQAERETWHDEASAPTESVFVLLKSRDVEPGLYSVTADSIGRIGGLPDAPPDTYLGIQREFATGTGVLSVCGDLVRAQHAWGDHGYRLLMTRASALVYDFYLHCVAIGLGGTVFAGFNTASARGILDADCIARHHLFAATFARPVPLSW